MTTSPDTRPNPPAVHGRAPVNDPVNEPENLAELDQIRHLAAEYDQRIAGDLQDVLIHQIFTVSLDLHAALSLTGDRLAADRIRRAINGLDQAIRDLRTSIFELGRPPGW